MGSLQPTFTVRKPTWRGSTSSEDMNNNFSEILYDLNVAFNEVSSLSVKLNEMESVLRHQVDALSVRTYAVSGIMTSYQQTASGTKMLHESFDISDRIEFPTSVATEDRCVVETEFGVCTLPVINSFSKVYTTNLSDSKPYQAPDLVTNIVSTDEAGYIELSNTSALRSVDGKDDETWERKLKYLRDSDRSSIECELEIELPSTNNPYVNRVFIRPYPEGTVDVTDFEYNTSTSQGVTLPTFPADGKNNIRSTMWSFNDIEPTKFTVTLRQRNNAIEDNYRMFVYGAREIGIEKVEYKSTGKVGIKFKLPSYETKLFQHITLLETDPAYDDSIYKVYLYASESDFNSNNPAWTSSNSVLSTVNPLDITLYATDTIWVMIELTQETGTSHSPLLESVTLTYTTQ